MSVEPTKADLLADLESRQDEVLRLLAELEQRTLDALNQLSGGGAVQPTISGPTVGVAPNLDAGTDPESRPLQAPPAFDGKPLRQVRRRAA